MTNNSNATVASVSPASGKDELTTGLNHVTNAAYPKPKSRFWCYVGGGLVGACVVVTAVVAARYLGADTVIEVADAAVSAAVETV